MFEIADIKKELFAGKKKSGTLIWALTDQFLPLVIRRAGFEMIVIDMEHSAYDFGTVQALVQACRSCGLFPIVRVPEPTKIYIQKVLDMGARGITIPMMRSVEQARELVRLAKYVPDGERGLGLGIGHNDFHGVPNIGEYMKQSNEQTILLVQPENQAGVDNLADILDVPGIDGIQTGPLDLSASYKVPGDFNSKVFKEANEKTIKITRGKNKLVVAFAMNNEQAKTLVEWDVNVLCMNNDAGLLAKAYKDEFDMLEKFKK